MNCLTMIFLIGISDPLLPFKDSVLAIKSLMKSDMTHSFLIIRWTSHLSFIDKVMQSHALNGGSCYKSLLFMTMMCFLINQKRATNGPNAKLCTSLILKLEEDFFSEYLFWFISSYISSCLLIIWLLHLLYFNSILFFLSSFSLSWIWNSSVASRYEAF